MLQPGQIVKYENELWRVEYVNPSRAYLVPTTKRKIVIADEEGGVKRVFESSQRGVNVSANSLLEVVEDVERERTTLELAEAERELAVLRAQMTKPTEPKVMPAPAGQGWHLVGAAPFAPQGTLKRAVLDFLVAHPGCSTKDIIVDVPGNVGACVSRFAQAGLIKKGGVII